MQAKRGQVRERIFRVLLNNKKLTKYRIAKEAKANIAWVIKTLRKLEAEDTVYITEVKDYENLIRLWKDLRTKPDYREYMIRDPLKVIQKADMKYALTTYSAENRVQKYLFPTRTDFYIMPEDMKKWHEILSEKGLVGKGNVRVLMADKHVFYKSFEREGMTVVSIPQLIVDLMTEGAAAAEAADMLIKKEKQNDLSGLRN